MRNDGYGPWDIGVAMREEITEKEGPLEAHRSILEGLQHHNNPWPQPRTERGRWAEGLGLPKPGQTAASTLLFAGCSADQPSGRAGALSLAKLLQRAGEDFAVLGESESCCGLYAKDLGFRREYYRLEEENSALVGKTGIKRIVTACASCHRIWKGYPKAALAGVEIRHGVEQLEKLVREGRLTFSPVARTKVTYHDPCHLGRGCGIYEPPRNLLRSVPGVELVEMRRNRRWSWCCGGGGGVPEAFPELARWNAEDRLREARETGAEVLLTTSALCLRSFALGEGSHIKVQDLFEFLAQAL